MNSICKYILVISCLFSYYQGAGQALIYLQEGQLEYSLGRPVQILEDSTATLTFKEVRTSEFNAKFKKSDSDHPNAGFNTHSYWYRFKVFNVADPRFKWLLHIGFPGLDTIEVYQIHKTGEIHKTITGDLFPFDDRPIKYKDFLIPLDLRRGETLEVYVRVAGISTKTWNAHIIEHSHFLEKHINITILNILLSGVIFGLFIYNLLLYLGTKQRGYLYYILYLFAFWCTYSFMLGYGFQFVFKNHPQLANAITNFAAIITLTLGSLFSRLFLKIPKIAPQLDQTIRILEFVAVLGSCIQLYSYTHPPAYLWGFNILRSLIYIYCPLFILMGVLALLKKVNTAKFYLLAWIFTIIGVIITILKAEGFLPNVWFTEYAVSIGVIIQASLFSFGLANQINIAEKEKRKAQDATIKALKENERMVKDQNSVLERLVQERTEELNANLETVSHQKREIERKNKNILSSINYASRIQQSILPVQLEFDKLFGKQNTFIYYRPKDIVSGDFYWLKQLDDKIIFAVIDCTGHGVPGALMSIVGYDLLNNAVNNLNLWQPNKILDSMQYGLDLVLRQYQKDSGDGLVISLCTYHPKQKKLYFAGARQALVYIQNREMKVIKGDKQSIGGFKKHLKPPHPFTAHELTITQPTTLYLYSDGYQDQFGGAKKRKFMAKNFRAFFLQNHEHDMEHQAQILDQQLDFWMTEGNEQQMDDITVLGIKLS
ncbi:MAG: 7TM diverse intracellular signaling domain-containing protein [Flammeovirgaceae bacterium]